MQGERRTQHIKQLSVWTMHLKVHQIFPERSLVVPTKKSPLPSSSMPVLGPSNGAVNNYLWHKVPHLHRGQYDVVCLLELLTRRILYVAETLSDMIDSCLALSQSSVLPEGRSGVSYEEKSDWVRAGF